MCPICACLGVLLHRAAVLSRTAQISAVDYSPLMIDGLRRKLAAAGPAAGGVTPHQLDATQLPREWAASFDGAFGNLCLMFIPEPVKGTLSAACLAWLCIGVGRTCGHPRSCGCWCVRRHVLLTHQLTHTSARVLCT